jgi:hypothetical protein
MFEFEEYKKIRQVYGWIIIIALSASLISWCLIVHMIVPDTPRNWDFGTLDDTPASSKYSIQSPPTETNVPLQISPPILQQKLFKK